MGTCENLLPPKAPLEEICFTRPERERVLSFLSLLLKYPQLVGHTGCSKTRRCFNLKIYLLQITEMERKQGVFPGVLGCWSGRHFRATECSNTLDVITEEKTGRWCKLMKCHEKWSAINICKLLGIFTRGAIFMAVTAVRTHGGGVAP